MYVCKGYKLSEIYCKMYNIIQVTCTSVILLSFFRCLSIFTYQTVTHVQHVSRMISATPPTIDPTMIPTVAIQMYFSVFKMNHDFEFLLTTADGTSTGSKH